VKDLNDLKVVILHDWLTGFRGGERVLEALCEMFPKAPIYTLIHSKGSTSPVIESREIHTSFLNIIPGVAKHYRKLLPLFPLAARSLKLPEDVDLVLSSSHCVIKGVRKPKGSVHVSYIHSPMRYLYDQYDAYFGPDAPFYQRFGMMVFKNYLTRWDLASNANVDYPIANAEFVRQRIERYYQIDSDVIHPFVDLDDFRELQKNPLPKENYYLMVTAFSPNKHVGLAIKAFNKMGLKLKIIGGGQQERELKAMARDNVEFLGNTSREDVLKTFAKAQALIFPGVEDFGITPLESLASGTPVIAYKIGGVLETLNDECAQFFHEQTPEALESAVLEFEKCGGAGAFSRQALLDRAEGFSRESFKKAMQEFIFEKLSKKSEA
jgi:glycosyltransferase involved in cell wall biosynthesis